jgi:hypothetical protein
MTLLNREQLMNLYSWSCYVHTHHSQTLLSPEPFYPYAKGLSRIHAEMRAGKERSTNYHEDMHGSDTTP